MDKYQADYTNMYMCLTTGECQGMEVFMHSDFVDWHARWQARLAAQSVSKAQITAIMKSHNPAIIPRNHLVEQALQAAQDGDISVAHNLTQALQNPYDYTKLQKEYSSVPTSTSTPYKTFCGT
jgi:uncharacterized protein YdiU (UPF0061 family)